MATHCPNLVCDTPGLWKGFDNLYYLVLATAGAVKSHTDILSRETNVPTASGAEARRKAVIG